MHIPEKLIVLCIFVLIPVILFRMVIVQHCSMLLVCSYWKFYQWMRYKYMDQSVLACMYHV